MPIHRDAAQPTIIRIRSVGPLLIDRPLSLLRAPQLIPSDTGIIMVWVPIRGDGTVKEDRLVPSEIVIGQAEHHITVCQRIERGPYRLADAGLPVSVVP